MAVGKLDVTGSVASCWQSESRFELGRIDSLVVQQSLESPLDLVTSGPNAFERIGSIAGRVRQRPVAPLDIARGKWADLFLAQRDDVFDALAVDADRVGQDRSSDAFGELAAS